MAIDYDAINVADTGEADVNVAFATMIAETIDTFPETMLTYISIANRTSFEISTEVSEKVSAAIVGGGLPQWVDAALNSVGVDINNAETVGLLTSLGVSAASITALQNTGKVTVPKNPGLKLGHLMTARQQLADAAA